MTSFILRIIALVAMTLDHTAAVFLEYGTPAYIVMRTAGRIAFPIFCFLIVEGFVHTSSLPNYLGRMAASAVLSEMPFDLAFHGGNYSLANGQNVFFTLLLGLLALTAIGRGAPWLLSKLHVKETACRCVWLRLLVASPAVIAACLAAEHFSTDYGWAGVGFICLYYVFRDRPVMAHIAVALLNSYAFCMRLTPMDASFYLATVRLDVYNSIQLWAPLSALPLLLYNGKPGSSVLKSAFYIYYPAHLVVIGVIAALTAG